jgi:hypothetical protein
MAERPMLTPKVTPPHKPISIPVSPATMIQRIPAPPPNLGLILVAQGGGDKAKPPMLRKPQARAYWSWVA